MLASGWGDILHLKVIRDQFSINLRKLPVMLNHAQHQNSNKYLHFIYMSLSYLGPKLSYALPVQTRLLPDLALFKQTVRTQTDQELYGDIA